jgi:hypothetical protein
MTTLPFPTFYDEALLGEPLPRRVRRRIIESSGNLWIIGAWPIRIPPVETTPARDVQLRVSELRAWTGWSARRLADVLGTSHTTVLAILGGRTVVASHSGDLRWRISAAHDVASRIFVIADRDPFRTAHALEDPPAHGGAAVDHLRRGDAARAYVAALDVLRPRTEGLLAGSRPRDEGATSPLHD